jgi:mRNA-degrading endonuclease YafQ of YafQ-DinJ toxin-antitoxin module
MWQLVWTAAFTRRCRKVLRRNPDLHDALGAALALLAEDPHHPRLRLHSLHGDREGLWAVRITYSVRLVLLLNDADQELTLLALGSHDETYR